MPPWRKVLPDTGAVNLLVKQLAGDDAVQSTVGSYAFADLNNDQTVELVVTIDYSGRACYSILNIIQINIDNVISINNIQSPSVDISEDGGKDELSILRTLEHYQGDVKISCNANFSGTLQVTHTDKCE